MNYLDLHKNSIVVDAHSDIPLHILINKMNENIDEVFKSYHLPLLKEGGVNIVFVNLFENLHPEGSLKEALIEVSELKKELESTDEAILIRNKNDLYKALKENKIGVVLSMEGMEPISNEIVLLRTFYELGLRSAMLTWNWRNYFASGSWETGGLSKLGKESIVEMENLGIIIDVSHLNEEGFWDIMKIAKNPVIASHSNAKALYNHVRNLSDDQIKAIANTGGVIGVNTYFTGDKEKNEVSIDTYMEHMEYLLEVAGEDHVGLGFDFNGYLGSPKLKGLEDCSKAPILTNELIKRGYSETTIKKVLGENFLRVLENILK